MHSPLSVRYSAAIPAGEHLLAAIAHAPAAVDPRALAVDLPCLGADDTYELWRSPEPVVHTASEGARISRSRNLLFAAWSVREADHPDLETAVAEVYRRMDRVLQAEGFPHVIKVWHYFAAINEGAGEAERYKRFCVGRARGMRNTEQLPAATAIGVQNRDAPLTVFLLAAREAGLRIENPRQVPAFRYPREYGPVSPGFARGALMPWGQLFVSGTAAVVGHASQHPGDAPAQLREAVENLRALVAESEKRLGMAHGRLRPQALKIYVRNHSDAPALRALADELFPRECPRLLLAGDICREELLVEVEGLYGL